MILSIVLFVVAITVEINGHGRMMDPPSRSAMWRLGFWNPINYNDNELFCGGQSVQWEQNDGKCGVCGDNYADPQPRENEAGGKYANGIIGRSYVVGQQIDINIELTANHHGWMEIKICPNNDIHKIVDQACLDKYPLKIVGQDTSIFSIPENSLDAQTFRWKVQLPEHLTCSQCVVQWTWKTASDWGTCENGTEGMGCGPQETFVNCADTEILQRVQSDEGSNPNPSSISFRGDEFSNIVKKDDSIPDDAFQALVLRSQLCIPVGEYKEKVGMNDWCRINCMKYPPECPPEKCKCVFDCEAVGEFSKLPGANIFCNENCLRYPSNCPEEKCKCS